MNCPVCPATMLQPDQPAPGLAAQRCPGCGGLWIASTSYWSWLEQLPEDKATTPSAGQPEVADVARAKRCPGCGYLQLHYQIDLDLPFALDQCGHCNSFWLDRGEWEALRLRGLDHLLHRITSDTWQHALREEASRRTWEAIYTEKFGAADYAEARRIKAWLDRHPSRQMLLAYLTREE